MGQNVPGTKCPGTAKKGQNVPGTKFPERRKKMKSLEEIHKIREEKRKEYRKC